MSPEVLERIGIGAGLLAAFALGLALGGRMCGATVTEESVVVKEVLVDRDCAPCGERVAAKSTKANDKPNMVKPQPDPKGPKTQLPNVPPPDAVKRRRLLAWVRTQTRRMPPCGQVDESGRRVVVTVELDDAKVKSVGVDSDGVSNATVRCVRNDVQTWEFPTELVKAQRDIVFGITL